jgi:hypothetical protein
MQYLQLQDLKLVFFATYPTAKHFIEHSASEVPEKMSEA